MASYTKQISVGGCKIGGGAPVSVQSMTNTDTRDIGKTIEQINRLSDAGCDIIRVAVPDIIAANAISKIKSNIKLPLVADIHFDYKLAITCIENGADKIRINPGNIGDLNRIKAVCDKARQYNIPIRIGVNAGSLEKDILDKYKKICAQALVDSAKRHINLLNRCDFDEIVLSLKASSLPIMIEAYRLISKQTSYPLHLGVTEAGTYQSGIIKSSAAIGSLLFDNIGDTIRFSLTDDPVLEVSAALELLRSLNLRKDSIEVISCPTCGRCQYNMIPIAKKVYDKTRGLKKNIKVAVMGCGVNGPGEAKDADIGIAGGKGEGLLFKKGKVIKKVKEDQIFSELMNEIEKM